MYSSSNKTRKFIPSQRIIGSNKELFIIKYEGSVIEIHRTNNLYEPLIVQLNGVIVDTIPSKQKKEISFSIADGSTHNLEVWNERVENSPLVKPFVKDGIAIVIDGVPVQNSLADPLTGLSRPKVFLWLLTAFLFFISIIDPIIRIQQGFVLEYSIFVVAYIILFIVALSATLTFQTNPIRSVWIAIGISVIELIYTLYVILTNSNFNIFSIIFLVLRLSILFSLFYSLKHLKSLLEVNQEEKVKDNKIEKKINKVKKRKILTLRNNLIFVFSIILIVGLYFGISEIIKSINEPAVDRDSSIVLRSDLILPDLIPYRERDKWGYCDRNKNIVISVIYDFVGDVNNNSDLLIVNMNGLYGVIDRKGNKIIPFIYTSISNDSNNKVFIAKRDQYKNGVIDDHNNVVIPFDYERLIPWGKYYITEKKINGKSFKGLLSNDGELVIDFIYTDLSQIQDNKNSLICTINKTIYRDYDNYRQNVPFKIDFFGLIDSSGKIILPIEYDIIDYDLYRDLNSYKTNRMYLNKNNLIKVKKLNELEVYLSRNTGVYDVNGNRMIPCQYDDIFISKVTNKYISAKLDNKWGILNNKNEMIIPFMYDFINIGHRDSSIYFNVYLDGKGGVTNEAGEFVIPMEYSSISPVKEDEWVSVSKELRYGMIDFKNKIKVPFEYSDWIHYFDGMARVQKMNEDDINKLLQSSNVYDSSYINNLISEFIRSDSFIERGRSLDFDEFKDQLITPELRQQFYRNNKEYFTDYPMYEEFAMRVVSGYRWKSKFLSKWGYLDNKGKLKIDFIYDDAKEFQNGFAKVKYKEKWGLINKNNQVVIPIKYDDIDIINNYNLMKVRLDEKWGYVDLNGVEYFTND